MSLEVYLREGERGLRVAGEELKEMETERQAEKAPW